MTTTALLLAAGMGSRLGVGIPKAFWSLRGRPMFLFSVEAMEASGVIDSLVLVVPQDRLTVAREMLRRLEPSMAHDVVVGGESRGSSVRKGLAAVPSGTDVVVCHDAARPFASPELFRRVVQGLQNSHGVVPLVPSPDTVKRLEGRRIVETIPRDTVGLAQTPQAFRADALRSSHDGDPIDATDDAALLERRGFRVASVEGEPANFKITTSDDLSRAEARFLFRTLGARPSPEPPGATTSAST